MREIKFRGLDHENKKWVFGWYTCLIEGTRKIHAIISDEDGLFLRYYIHESKTIGQYTGLKDKNGVEIYEGDILRTGQTDSVENPREWRGDVEFDVGAFVVDGEYLRDSEPFRFEVIGNIHENPELLTGQ